MKKATVICDMQYGSTGKGLIAGYLAERDAPDVVMTAWSMNAGHTYIDKFGRKFIHCMLANGVVSPRLMYVLIGPGSQIGLERLFYEVLECRDLLAGVTILIHPNACVIDHRHIEEENGTMTAIGSTKKGCGAALIEKIRRSPQSDITAFHYRNWIMDFSYANNMNVFVCTHSEYQEVVEKAHRIQVEGAQGYSLGINSGFYPYTTSRECTPAQIASDVLLPLPFIDKVVGTMRTYPIRVANRYDENGVQVGWSGPCYPDQSEISFAELGQETEMTTVTKLPRRIFTFSWQQTLEAARAIRPDEVFINFMNYCQDQEEQIHVERTVNHALTGIGHVRYLGNGATVNDVYDLSSTQFPYKDWSHEI